MLIFLVEYTMDSHARSQTGARQFLTLLAKGIRHKKAMGLQ
jgi:hypothetical protein